jgi:hypothetical protein
LEVVVKLVLFLMIVFVSGDYQGLFVVKITKLAVIDTYVPRTCCWVEGFPSGLLLF